MKHNYFYKNISRIKHVLVLILVVSLFSACGKSTEKQQPEKNCLTETMKNEMEFHKVEMQQIKERLNLNGKVETNPEKMINFISLVEGQVVNTNFSLGDEVKKGQLLAEIRSVELSGMQAERRTLTSQLTVAIRQLASVTSMHKDGIASERDLLQAQSDVDIIEADLEKVTTNLNLFSSTGSAGVFQIKAPSSGIIIYKNIAPGMQIAEGDALFTISDLTEVWVSINVYAGNVGSIITGMPVEIKTMSYPNEVFDGNISRLSQVFDVEERVLKARVVMENKDFKLKPGMLVDVTVKKDTEEKGLAVPNTALIFDNNQNYLLVYKDDCEIERRNVSIHSESNGMSYIRSGISEGEQVVSKNQLILFEQLKDK